MVTSSSVRRATGARRAAVGLLAALLLVSVVARAWAALRIPSPWYVPDEVIYEQLGRSLYRDGSLDVFGEPTPFYSLLYPLLVGVPLSLENRELGYGLLKLVQPAVMSAAGVVAYGWARSFARPGWAVVAAGLTLAVPGLAFTGFVMSEVAFYPVFCAAAWAAARALATAALGAQLLAVALTAAAATTRLQAIVVAPALVLAVLLKTCFDRTWLRGVRRYAPLLLALVGLGVAVVAANLVRGVPLLGAYQATAEASYDPAAVVRFAGYHAADLLLITCVFPVAAVAILARDAFLGREPSPDVQAYLAVAIALSATLVVQVGMFASSLLGRLAERNLLGLAPVLFVGLALWLDRGAPRPRALTAAVAASLLLLFVVVPWDDLITAAATPDAPALVPLYQLTLYYPELDIRVFVVGLAGLLLALLLLVPPRLVSALPALAATLLLVSSVSATDFATVQARDYGRLMVGSDRDWVDDATAEDVVFLYTGELDWSGGGQVWMHVFWNDRIRSVYRLERAPRILGPIPDRPLVYGAEGRLLLPGGRPLSARHVVASTSVAFVGRRVAVSDAAFALWRVDPPVRLAPP